MPKKMMILGPPGVGKSTLTNSFCGNVAKCGDDAEGVTEDVVCYNVMSSIIAGWQIVDVPGYGGEKGSPAKLSIKINKFLANQSLDLLCICVAAMNVRLEMANHFITELVNKFIKGNEKWDNVIFVVTQKNIGEANGKDVPTLVESYRQAVKKKVASCPATHVIAVGQGLAELAPLIAHMQRIKAPIPKAASMASNQALAPVFMDLMSEVWDIPKDIVKAEVIKAAEADGDCVAKDGIVQVLGKGQLPISELAPGDYVLDKNGFTQFVGFMHVGTDVTDFIEVFTSSTSIKTTPTHLVPTSCDGQIIDVEAKDIKVGDWLQHACGEMQQVCSVACVKDVGYVGPLTVSGTLFVNDVLVSCFVNGGVLRFPSPLVMWLAMLPMRCMPALDVAAAEAKGGHAMHWYPALLRNVWFHVWGSLVL